MQMKRRRRVPNTLKNNTQIVKRRALEKQVKAELREQAKWHPMGTAPRDATDVCLRLKDGSVVVGHFAQNLLGDEQPAYSGWFTEPSGSSRFEFREVNPKAWRPLED